LNHNLGFLPEWERSNFSTDPGCPYFFSSHRWTSIMYELCDSVCIEKCIECCSQRCWWTWRVVPNE